MTRSGASPARRAAATKSLWRSDSVSARKTRALQAQPASVSTSAEPHRARRQVGGEDDRERQAGDDEEDVGEDRRRASSTRPPGVPGADADDDADERHEEADGEADAERDARADDGLREHVLPLPGGAEQVAPRRRRERHVDERAAIADDERADERHHGEAAERAPTPTAARRSPSSARQRLRYACARVLGSSHT